MEVKLHFDSRRKRAVRQSIIFTLTLYFAANSIPFSLAQTTQNNALENQKNSTTTSITLAELQRLALQNHPTLAQAEAAIRAAEGRKLQAGLLPNPILGYRGEEF